MIQSFSTSCLIIGLLCVMPQNHLSAKPAKTETIYQSSGCPPDWPRMTLEQKELVSKGSLIDWQNYIHVLVTVSQGKITSVNYKNFNFPLDTQHITDLKWFFDETNRNYTFPKDGDLKVTLWYTTNNFSVLKGWV